MTDRRLDDVSATAPTHLADALAEITTRLVGDADSASVLRMVIDVGTGLLEASGIGVMLSNPRGGAEVVAASDEPARFVELLQTQTEQGPCVECIASGSVVVSADLARERARWAEFTPAALEAGFRSVVAVPLQLNGRVVGGFNLLYRHPGESSETQLRVARALSDLVVLGLVQESGERRADRLLERTLAAFNDQVLLGQAIGLVAGALGIDPETGRAAIRAYAARHHRAIGDVARAVTGGTLQPADLATASE